MQHHLLQFLSLLIFIFLRTISSETTKNYYLIDNQSTGKAGPLCLDTDLDRHEYVPTARVVEDGGNFKSNCTVIKELEKVDGDFYRLKREKSVSGVPAMCLRVKSVPELFIFQIPVNVQYPTDDLIPFPPHPSAKTTAPPE